LLIISTDSYQTKVVDEIKTKKSGL